MNLTLLLLILLLHPTLIQSSPSSIQPSSSSRSSSFSLSLFSTILNSFNQFINIPSTSSPNYKSHSFTLKQAYHKGTHSYPNLTAKLDYHPFQSYSTYNNNHSVNYPPTFSNLRSKRQVVTRPRDPKAFLKARENSYEKAQCAAQDALDWDDVEIDAPDVDHRPTLLALAKMASQAYDNDTSRWEPGFGGFNLVSSQNDRRRGRSGEGLDLNREFNYHCS